MSATEPAAGGLSSQEAAAALQRHGYNEMRGKRRRTVLHVMLEVMREPMFLLLIAAGSIYLMLGDPGDALMLLGFVFITMGITIAQERRTERALERLKDLSSPRALVMRDGVQLRIAGREVVPGDLLVLEEGDRVAADASVIEAHDLLVDESLLTGESVPVFKHAAFDTASAQQGAGQVVAGSMVVQGGGFAKVTATGAETALGRIGKSLQTLEPGKSRLQLEIAMLVKRFAVFAAVVSLSVLLLYGSLRGDWLNGLLAGITLAMSILPEEFAVILTVFMALGAWRISNHQVLTRHTPVIEALGSATVLCVDKTGTLTQNRMTVKTVVAGDETYLMANPSCADMPDGVAHVLEYTVLASEISPFDPMEKAFHRCLSESAPQRHAAHQGWQLVFEYSLTRGLPAMTHVWRPPQAQMCVLATKGAPEAVARLCRFNPQQTAAMLAQVEGLAEQGQRVLAVARAEYPYPADGAWPASQEAFDFTGMGLVGLADPLRPEVADAVHECRQAGIRVVMITGDYPATARAIAREAGLASEQVISGAELDRLDEVQLSELIGNTQVFARIVPEQKLRLVNTLKKQGEIVAMTGDGVNDAPALRAAHIGIAMGQRGTDVAREAASLVLLNDDFASIVRAIRLGRRIYANLRKAMIYVVAVHVPIMGMTILPLLAGTPLAFSPVHIVFLEMIINPACAIVFEAEHTEPDIMQKPPRDIEESLFGTRAVVLALLQGIGLLAAVAGMFFYALHSGQSEGQARALAFACIVTGNLGMIVVNRSSSTGLLALLRVPNRAQWWVVAATAVALIAVLELPVLRTVFHFAPPAPGSWLLLCAVLATVLAWAEMVKRGLYLHGRLEIRNSRLPGH